MILIYRKGWMDSLVNYRSVSVTRKEQTSLSATTWHMQDHQGIRIRLHGFIKDRSCLTNQFCFYGKVFVSWWVRESL